MNTNRFVAMSFAALLLVGTSGGAFSQATDQDHDAHHPEQTERAPTGQPDQSDAFEGGMPGMMGRGMGMMSPEMMQRMHRMMRMQEDDGISGTGMMPGMMGMMGRGMMHHGGRHAAMMRLIFVLMDADGDGALSLEEAQAVTERIFNAIDADNDGRVTLDDIREFYSGTERSDQRTPRHDDTPTREDRRTHDGMPMEGASRAYMEAMDAMMDDMADMEMTGDPATDFAVMMIPHHRSAIEMAEALLQHSDDPQLTQLANEIIAEQQREIEFLEDWLREQEQ